MNYRKSRIVYRILIAVSVVLLTSAMAAGNEKLKVILAVSGMFAYAFGFVILRSFWRCPFCEQALPIRSPDILYCPYCSKELP